MIGKNRVSQKNFTSSKQFLATILLLVLSVTVPGCSKEDLSGSIPTPTPARANEVLRITSENVEKAGTGKLLAAPYLTTTDQQKNIYTLDSFQNMIFKFDKNGNFLKTIGSEGNGPGEFQSVYTMAITGNNHLFVYDYMSHRATLFNGEGQVDQVIPLEYNQALFDVRKKSGSKFLFPLLQDDYILHIFDTDKVQIAERFAHVDEILHTQHPFEWHLLKTYRGAAIALSDYLIAYTPGYYNGTIYLYERDETDWNLKEIIPGYERIDQSFTIHETTDAPHDKAMGVSVHPEGTGYLGFELHSWSFGLYPLAGSRFMHLSYRDADAAKSELQFVLEIFDYSRGGLQKFAFLDEVNTSFPPEKMPVWADTNGFLYVVDEPDNPSLLKLEVEW